MTALLCAALSIALAVPSMPRPRHAARVEKASRIRTAKGSALGRARARLAQVKRDPLLRRYRCHWERAIGALEKAARGRDRSQALIEAARARYAL
ncbi:MAG TPA: N-acetylmuramoyl-L-alanine amidase, partial [Anaeromyxobacteraceae bacterium]|nr:N-acetylmuramoyl-L-alanine amidase [Anaeromyxobacteraceae bacterium]